MNHKKRTPAVRKLGCVAPVGFIGHGLVLLVLLLAGCAAPIPSSLDRRAVAEALGARQGWTSELLANDELPVVVFRPRHIVTDTLTVYIEGDGLAWLSEDTPSKDPTPRDPLALRLALAQPAGTAVYLARPCQYYESFAHTACRTTLWTAERFSPQIVRAMSRALDQLKAEAAARELHLVGYSGGAAVALLLAAQRDDVPIVLTVAGNVDTRAWTELHRVSPLTGSLNPADFSAQLARLQLTHLVGRQDRIVPPTIAQGFAARVSQTASHDNASSVHILEGYDHRCCWADAWPELWRTYLGGATMPALLTH